MELVLGKPKLAKFKLDLQGLIVLCCIIELRTAAQLVFSVHVAYFQCM